MEGTALRAEGENHYDGYYNYSETCSRCWAARCATPRASASPWTANVGRADNESDNYNDEHLAGRRADPPRQRLGAGRPGHRRRPAAQRRRGLEPGQPGRQQRAGYLVDSRDNTGVFVQYQGRFGAHHLQASVRNDDNEQFGNHTTGSLGWGMELGGGFRLNASYGTAFKAPTFSDLYDPWSGVPGLDPEKSKSANLGIAQQGEGWRWGLDVYETRIDDLITYDATTFMHVAGGEGANPRCRADRLALTVAGFDLSAQLSHTDPRNRTNGSAQFDNWLARRAQDTARLDIDRRFGGFRAGVTAFGAGKRYDNAANSVRLAGYGTRGPAPGIRDEPRLVGAGPGQQCVRPRLRNGGLVQPARPRVPPERALPAGSERSWPASKCPANGPLPCTSTARRHSRSTRTVGVTASKQPVGADRWSAHAQRRGYSPATPRADRPPPPPRRTLSRSSPRG